VTPVIQVGSWDELQSLALPVRETVFVIEQGVPAELERDEQDPHSVHALACVDGQPVGTGRLTPDGHIGRMAVLPAWRGRGIGTSLLQALIAQARSAGLPALELNAQLHAIPFYRRLGFIAEGEVFDDAGLPHRRMHYPLAAPKV
jgi:predicted GNAT family N-acyltransferase